MELIPDDPIVRSLLETGYPPWFRNRPEDYEDEEWEDEEDVYFGNETVDF